MSEPLPPCPDCGTPMEKVNRKGNHAPVKGDLRCPLPATACGYIKREVRIRELETLVGRLKARISGLEKERLRFLIQLGNLHRVHSLAGKVLEEIRALMDESGGVYGLHLNGDPAPWSELGPGCAYEHLGHLDLLEESLGRPSPILGMLVEVDPTLAPDTVEFRCGDRVVARIENIGAAEPNSKEAPRV